MTAEKCDICKQIGEHLPLCPKHIYNKCEDCPKAQLVHDECDIWWRCTLKSREECPYE